MLDWHIFVIGVIFRVTSIIRDYYYILNNKLLNYNLSLYASIGHFYINRFNLENNRELIKNVGTLIIFLIFLNHPIEIRNLQSIPENLGLSGTSHLITLIQEL